MGLPGRLVKLQDEEGMEKPAEVVRVASVVSNELDRILSDRIRLAVISALAANECLSFSDLQRLLGASDGNISVHVKKLELAGYLKSEKSFNDRVPRTEYFITEAGREALTNYLSHMEALIAAMKA